MFVEDPQTIKEIDWLFRLPSKSTKEDFYHNTIHVEDGVMVTTDGRWIRMIKSPESTPGDFIVQKNKNGWILKQKRSDDFWFFPPSWKKVYSMEHKPTYEHLSRQDLAYNLYHDGIRVPLDLLYHMDHEEFKYTVYRETGVVVIKQWERQLTVMLTE